MFDKIMSRASSALLVMFMVTAAACGSEPAKKNTDGSSANSSASGGGGGGTGSLNGGGGDGGGGGSSSGGSAGSSQSCSVGEDCPYWYCECADGGVVNARTCNNNQCAPASGACPSACESFGSSWTGTTITLDDDDSSNDGGSSSTPPSTTNSCTDVDPVLVDDSSCYSCAEQECCFDLQQCSENGDCVEFFYCKADGYTNEECLEFYPGAASDLEFLGSCLSNDCSATCT